jgi:hypothetical protein
MSTFEDTAPSHPTSRILRPNCSGHMRIGYRPSSRPTAPSSTAIPLINSEMLMRDLGDLACAIPDFRCNDLRLILKSVRKAPEIPVSSSHVEMLERPKMFIASRSVIGRLAPSEARSNQGEEHVNSGVRPQLE